MKCWNYVIEKKFFLENKKDDIQDGMNYQIKGFDSECVAGIRNSDVCIGGRYAVYCDRDGRTKLLFIRRVNPHPMDRLLWICDEYR